MAVTFTPSSSTFSTPGLKTLTQSVTVANSGASSVTVTLGGDSDFTLATTSAIAAGGSATLQVSYRATKVAGGTATLTASDGTTSTLTGTPSNPLTLASSTEFGTTTPGGTLTQMISVGNQSDTEAAFSGVSAPFTIPGAYSTIAAGFSLLSIPVTYSPPGVSDDTQTATLTVGAWSVPGTLHGNSLQANSGTSIDVAESQVAAPAADNQPAGATYQSYYVNIPNPPTSFNLGYKRQATLKVNGIAIDTVGFAYLHTTDDIGIIASGTDSSNNPKGSIFTQSAVDTIMIADGDILATSTGAGAWLVGKAGVAIGTMSSSRQTDSDSLMPTDAGVKSTKLDLNMAATAFLSLDALIAFATLGVTTWAEVTSAKMFGENVWNPKYMISKFVTVTAALAAVTLDIVNTVSATTGSAGAPGITMYAHAGILAGTPGFASYYAGAGLVIGSLYPTMIGMDTAVLAMKDLSLLAISEATLSGKSATVHGSKEVKIESSEVIELRTRKVDVATVSPNAGTIEIKPKKIEAWVTDHADTKSKISMYEISETKVETSVKDSTDDKSELKMVPKQIELSCANKTATEKVGLDLTPTKAELSTKDASGESKLEMKPTEILLDAGPTGKITLKAGHWEIEIGPTGITLKGPAATAGAITLADTSAVMKLGPATSVELATAGVSLKGTLVNNG